MKGVEEKTQEGVIYGEYFYEAIIGGGCPLRSSDKQVEPQDEALYLRGAQQYLHHRPPADSGVVSDGLQLCCQHGVSRGRAALCRHKKAGPGVYTGRIGKMR